MKYSIVLALCLNLPVVTSRMAHGFGDVGYESESSGPIRSDSSTSVENNGTREALFDSKNDDLTDDEGEDASFFPGLSGNDGKEADKDNPPPKPRHYRDYEVYQAIDALICLNTSYNVIQLIL